MFASRARCARGDDEQARTQNVVSLAARYQMQLTKTVAAKPHCVQGWQFCCLPLLRLRRAISEAAAEETQGPAGVTNRPRVHKFV